MKLKRWLKATLSPAQYAWVVGMGKAVLEWPAVKAAGGWICRDNLSHLARWYGTDKCGSHWYTQHYQRYFAPIKNKRLNVLEIGVGGYANANKGGASLRMWRAYFRKSRIVGIDIYDKSRFSEHRIDIRQCDQTDAEALRSLSNEFGGFDIVIDDGSHINDDIIETFNILFPLLRDDGIYAVEDTQTSYWPTWGGGIGNSRTAMAFFKNLADGLNYVEYPIADYQPNCFERNIVEIAFFHNLVIVRKGVNNEKSNVPHMIKQELAALRNGEDKAEKTA